MYSLWRQNATWSWGASSRYILALPRYRMHRRVRHRTESRTPSGKKLERKEPSWQAKKRARTFRATSSSAPAPAADVLVTGLAASVSPIIDRTVTYRPVCDSSCGRRSQCLSLSHDSTETPRGNGSQALSAVLDAGGDCSSTVCPDHFNTKPDDAVVGHRWCRCPFRRQTWLGSLYDCQRRNRYVDSRTGRHHAGFRDS